MGRRKLILLVAACSLLAAVPAHADSQSLAGKKIALDAGHGGTDPGASGFGLNEKTVTLDIVLRAKTLLEAEGASVLLTRDCDCTVSLTQRTDAANAWGAHRFISIHANACGSCGGHGTETYFHDSLPPTSTAADLAGKLQGEMIAKWGLRDRGVKQANFHVLRESNMPAALVETAFIDHSGDNAVLADGAKRQEAARAVLHAVQRHFGLAPHDPVQQPPPTFTVAIASPADDTWLRGTVTARGTTNQEGNLNWMRFLVDGAVTKWVTPAPHAWDWDTTAWADGAHALKLEAENGAGARASAAITAKVDNTPPVASITRPDPGTLNFGAFVAPLPGLTVAAGDVPVEAAASDAASGMARVVFTVDGVARFTDTAAPWAWTWPAGEEALGDHTLGIAAYDVAGNVRTRTLTVDLTVPVG